eukprot:GHVS01065685.1.p1 GENE.GHVS01065685.1~~GHVS01065685.1.p1  ORF type:complete len:420 (-),score=55.23 GHVS01065685.1:152-1411(-)
MAACASSRRVALWMTVSLLCVVYTLATKDGDGYKTVTALLFDPLSLDGFVAGLLYAKYWVGRDETSIMLAHDGTKNSSSAVQAMVEDKIKEHYLKMVYLGTSPVFQEGGYTEYGMLNAKLPKEFDAAPGLKTVKVFDNRSWSDITYGGWEEVKGNFETHLRQTKSVSQQIVEMVEKNGGEVAEYYKWLVEFAGFIEMDGYDEGERIGKLLSVRYKTLITDSKTSTILPYFLAPWFDGMFTKLRNDFVQHAVDGQWSVPSRRIEDAEAAVREFYVGEKEGLTASKFEVYCADFDKEKKEGEKKLKPFKVQESGFTDIVRFVNGLYVEIPASVPTNLFMKKMRLLHSSDVVIGKRQKELGSVFTVWNGKEVFTSCAMSTMMSVVRDCGGVQAEGRRFAYQELEMDADAEGKFEKFLAENKD